MIPPYTVNILCVILAVDRPGQINLMIHLEYATKTEDHEKHDSCPKLTFLLTRLILRGDIMSPVVSVFAHSS